MHTPEQLTCKDEKHQCTSSLEDWPYLLMLNKPCDSVVLLLSLYTNEIGVYDHPKTCSRIFKIVLFVIGEHWKSLNYPLEVE